MKICKFCKEVSMKVIPDNGQSSANTSRKSNKTRTEENGAIAYISTFMPKMQTCSRRSKVQNMSSEVYRSSQLRSTLNTGYIKVWTCVRVCTEAVHCVALGLWKQKNVKTLPRFSGRRHKHVPCQFFVDQLRKNVLGPSPCFVKIQRVLPKLW